MKTSELTGAALDWAVWACEKPDDEFLQHRRKCRPYSTDWSQGGPIIERECMEFDYDEATQIYTAANGIHAGQGKTHLIAAMRCYVASQLGDEVDVPAELED